MVGLVLALASTLAALDDGVLIALVGFTLAAALIGPGAVVHRGLGDTARGHLTGPRP